MIQNEEKFFIWGQVSETKQCLIMFQLVCSHSTTTCSSTSINQEWSRIVVIILKKGWKAADMSNFFLTTNHSSTDVSRLPQPLDPLQPYGLCIFGPPGCIWQPVRDTFHEFSGWTTKMTMKPPTSFGVKMAICLSKRPSFLPPLTFHIKPNATPRHTKAIKNAFVTCWKGAK